MIAQLDLACSGQIVLIAGLALIIAPGVSCPECCTVVYSDTLRRCKVSPFAYTAPPPRIWTSFTFQDHHQHQEVPVTQIFRGLANLLQRVVTPSCIMITAFHTPLHIVYPGLGRRYIGLREIQTRKPVPSNRTRMSSKSRELPMPNVSKLSSLGQAHATLLHCWTRISRFACEYLSPATPTSPQSSPIIEEREHFHRWLEQWEVAFTEFLTNAMPSMTNEDVTESRVLKANHLACAVLASDGLLSTPDGGEADFRAIVELSGAVLRIRHLTDSPQERQSEASPTSASQLDVKEPLHVVVSRCSQESIRAHALELLSHF